MLHAYFYIPAKGNTDQKTDERNQSSFSDIFDKEHASVPYKPSLPKERKEKRENSALDFINFYDIFGAFNY